MNSIPKTILLLLAFICGFAACSAEPERSLMIYTPHGKDLLQDFAAKYEAQNPGVRVNFADMGSREVFERIRAERNRPQADLWWGASQMTFQDAADENLLAAYKPSWADKTAANSHDKNDFWYGQYETPEVIAFNSNLLNAATAPPDWDAVLDEKYNDKILIRDPIPSDSMRVIFGALVQKEGSPERGYEWLKKLDKNVKEYTSDGTILMQKLAREEGSLTLWNMPDVMIFKEQKNLPVDYIFPTSGAPVVTDGIAVVKGAPHEEEARKFYEFVTTPENLIYAANKYYRLPVARNDLDKSKLPAWMQTEFKRMNVDFDALRKNGAELLKHWNAEIRGKN